MLARYDRDGQKYVLLLVDYPTEGEAKAAESRFTDALLAGKVVAQKEGNLAFRRKGQRLVAVLGAIPGRCALG